MRKRIKEKFKDKVKNISDEKFILETYNNALYKRNEIAKFKNGSRIFSGIVKEVDSYGRLIVESDTEQSFETGQLEWIL